jgi:hypothetical protein
MIAITATRKAEAMGRRAGEQLRDRGIPSGCPIALRKRDDLAAAWRRGYAAGVAPAPGRRRRAADR